jgi:hypothetical protein
MRDTQTVTIDGNTSTVQAYGVHLRDRRVSRNAINGLAIAYSNILQPNTFAPIYLDPIVALIGYAGPDYTVGPIPPLETPRALAINAVSPGESRCMAAGYRRQIFKFSASEVTGASSIRSIEAVFSIQGNDADGSGGPGGPPSDAPYCHFYYHRETRVVYLDDHRQDYLNTWPTGQSSVVGPGGSDVTNGYCTIHAGSLPTPVQEESKVLSVSLDIEFLQSSYLSSQKHMYVLVGNINDLFSLGGQWKYWGWWATP